MIYWYIRDVKPIKPCGDKINCISESNLLIINYEQFDVGLTTIDRIITTNLKDTNDYDKAILWSVNEGSGHSCTFGVAPTYYVIIFRIRCTYCFYNTQGSFKYLRSLFLEDFDFLKAIYKV